MNTKEYIATGILERYALGQCTPAEMADVESVVAKYPDVKAELMEIETSLFSYAGQSAAEPPARVRENILNYVKASATQETPVVSIARPASGRWWLAAASIVMLIASIATNYVQYKQNNDLSGELAVLRDQNSVLAEDLNVTKAGYSESQKMMAMVTDTSTRVIPMNGMPAAPEMKATIYWNRSSSEVYVSVNHMPDPGTNADYQLWAIVGGVPVDAGIISMSGGLDSLQKMNSFPDAQAFAVTLEKKGGSPSPTLEKMVVIGNV